jgi:hypothetical protein
LLGTRCTSTLHKSGSRCTFGGSVGAAVWGRQVQFCERNRGERGAEVCSCLHSAHPSKRAQRVLSRTQRSASCPCTSFTLGIVFALLASIEIRNRLKAPTHHRLRSLGRSWLMHVHGAGKQDSKHRLGPQPGSKCSSPCAQLAAHSSGQVAHELIGMGTRRRSWHQARPWRGHDYRYGGARGNGVRLACSVQGRMHTVAPSFEIHERQRGAAG